MILSLLNSAYMHDLPKKTQSRSDSARFRAAWSIAPSALPSFLRTSSTFFAPAAWRSRAERRNGGPQAAPVRGIVYAPDQSVGLEAIDELGDVGSHARASRGQLAERHRLVGLHQLGQGGELGARQLHLRQGLFELTLDRLSRLHQRPHHVVRGGHGAAAARSTAFIHI